MISEKLGGIYSALENKFFGFFDFLEEKGIPVYSVIEPIEDKGIPFFPLTIALIVLLLVSAFGFASAGPFEAKIELNLKDSYGNPLTQVKVLVKDKTGQNLFSETKNHGDMISINASAGTELFFTAEKQGYEKNTAKIKVINESSEIELTLKKLINTIKGKIKFYDKETDTAVSGVVVLIDWKERKEEKTADTSGLVEFLDIPLEEDILITAKSDSYYEYSGIINFESEETKSVYLTPKEIAFAGESNLIITLFEKETGKLLENAKIKVYSDNELIDEKIVSDGVYSENFPKGIVVRFTAEKDGFKLFESDEFTLRSEEENAGSIELETGGKEVIIKVVYSDTKNPSVGAEVTLFNSQNEIINSFFTLYEGQTEFKGLGEEEYFIGAVKEGYLPAIKRIENGTETLELIKENENNSKPLTVLTINENEKVIENASLFFTQIIEGIEIPLGLGIRKTDAAGKLNLNVPLNAEIYVKAVKDLLTGKEKILIGEYNNNLLIKMEKKDSVKSIKFFDEKGQIVQGNLVIKTKEGEVLFDDEITEEEILFDAGNKNFVEIELTTTNKTYSEEINLEGKKDIKLNFDSTVYSKNAPEIEFLGVYDISGNEIEGITKGKEYILKFKTDWSKKTEKGGLHFRTGNDSIKYADSEDIGITGFDAPAVNYFYGRTYSMTPSPGNKEIDYSNKGQGGKLNKFVEIYFNKPEGTKIIKIRIKASELISAEKIKVKFRGWTETKSGFSRTPIDEIIGTTKDSGERQGLYAETKEIELKVYDSEPECIEEVCAEYNIIDETGKVYDKKDFFALKNKVYALELNLEARKTIQANFKLNTSNENPRIAFTGKQVNSFSQFIDNDNSDTLTEFTETVSRKGTKIRVYFKAKEKGESFIDSRITTLKDSMQENFYFKIFEEKEMQLTIPETANQGKDFEIRILEEGTGIENAEISFYNSQGRLETVIIGNEFNGKNGRYKIKNNFKAGNYLVKITADKFKTEEKQISVIYGKGLELEEEVKLNIPANELFASKRTKINNSSGERIENLSYELNGNLPKEFKLSVNLPLTLNSGEETEIELIAEYSGNSNAVVFGETEIIITGTINEIPIKAITKAKINYNQKLDEKCLEFDRSELKEYLIGAGGNSKQIELGLKNNCNVPLEFELEFKSKGNKDNEIEFNAGKIRIEKDEIKNIKIGVINKIQRNYVNQIELDYDIYFKSSQLTKTIPAKIILWHERYSLSVSPSIVLWLTQSKKGEKAVSRTPIFIRNTGFTDIQNLSFSFQFTKPGNTELKILWGNTPQKNIEVLGKGMGLIPPMIVEAQTNTKENQIIIGKIIVNGVIEGKQYMLREINTFINVSSGWSCLEAWSDDMQFYSDNAEFGGIDKILNITNNCVEPVIIKGLEPEKIGGNEINLIDRDYMLSPGASDGFIVRLTKQAEANQKTKLKVIGIGQNSRKTINSMPFEIEIAIGKGSGLCGDGEEPCKAENETTVEYCDESGYATMYFPKQSSNCSEGYCDAEELGKFLAEKFQEEIRKAQLRIAELKSVENLGSKCDYYNNYCSFGAMGITTSSFEFYFKNDNLSQDMLKNEIKKLEVKELQNYFIRPGETENELYSSAGNSFGEHLLLVPSIRGCGRYQARILGATATHGNEFKDNSISLLLKIEPREETPECYNRIQNFMNFLPLNESYSPANNKGSWLGIIIKDEDPEIEELQRNFSRTLFKDEKGIRITTVKQNNFITLREGNFDSTKGIVKIAIERKGKSNTPKEIDIYITDDFFNAPEEVRNDIASEAGAIISSLKNGRIEKGCISKELDYLILGSVTDITEIANIQWKDKTKLINLYPDAYSCADLKLQSKIESPETVLSWNLVNEELQGIQKTETVLKYKDGREITNKGEEIIPLNRVEWTEEGNLYSFNSELCFKGSDNPRQAMGSKIKLNVEGLKERTLQFGVCAITPIEFIERSRTKTKIGKWFATVDWKNKPEELPFTSAQAQYYLDNPEQSPAFKRDKELGKNKTIGLIGYGVGALGGCIGAGALTGGFGWLDCILNAGIPTAIGAFSDRGSVYDTAKTGYQNALASVGVGKVELNQIREETSDLTDPQFFGELELMTAMTRGAQETVKLVLPVKEEAKVAAQAAKDLASSGSKELLDELTSINTDVKSFNNARKLLSQSEITEIGTFPPGTKVRVTAIRTADVGGLKFIRTTSATNPLLVEGTTTFPGFQDKYDDLIKSFKTAKIGNRTIPGIDSLIDESFKTTGKKPVSVLNDLASDPDRGLLKRIDDWGAKVDQVAVDTPEGKILKAVKETFVENAGDDISYGGKPIRQTGITKLKGTTKIPSILSDAKAFSTKGKILSFLERNPRLKALGKGIVISGGGAMLGGMAGWMLANAFLGDFEEIPEAQADVSAITFRKGFTYEVKVGKNQTG